MQSRQDLLNSYIINTKFYDYLRNNLSGNLSAQELKELVSGIQSIARYKVENLSCTLEQSVYLIVVYGEICINGVTTRKGEYLKIQQISNAIEINFVKSTTILLINLQVLQFRIEQIKAIRQKMRIVQKCMPVKQLKLTISETRKVAKILQIREIHVKYSQIPQQPGFFVFWQGIFQICVEGIPALQVENNFIEITDLLEFTVRLKSNSGKYGFIHRHTLYEILAPEAVIQLEKLWKSRQQLKQSSKGKKQYLDASEILREKIRKKMKQIKKLSSPEKSHNEKAFKQSLEASRDKRLEKCSTLVTTLNSFSLGSSRKTTSSPSKSKTFYSVSNPIKQKESIKLSNTDDRLNKMRYFSASKSRTKLEKDWYYLEEDKMKQTLSMTYFKIKSTEKNPQQVSTMCNYKRIHRIYSDPCFKRCLTFRGY